MHLREEEPKSPDKPGGSSVTGMLGSAGTAVKDGIVGSLKGLQEIESQIVSLAKNTATDVLKATGAVANETLNTSKDLIKGTISATQDVGTGLLTGVKSVAKGIRRNRRGHPPGCHSDGQGRGAGRGRSWGECGRCG
jgi:hypothetical protein